MIIIVLIIPLSLPVIFITLFYYATQNPWLMTMLHLSAIGQWHGMTGPVCMTLLVVITLFTLIAGIMTAILTAFLNHWNKNRFLSSGEPSGR